MNRIRNVNPLPQLPHKSDISSCYSSLNIYELVLGIKIIQHDPLFPVLPIVSLAFQRATGPSSFAGNHSAPEQQGAAGPLLAAPGNLRCGISGVLLRPAVNQVVGSAKRLGSKHLNMDIAWGYDE